MSSKSLRFNIIAARLRKLGYIVHGGEFNTADFGLPQQRRRAWLVCILANQYRDIPGHSPVEDMNRFQRECLPLSSCLSTSVELTRKKGKTRQDKNPKWKKGLQEQYKILGQAGPAGGNEYMRRGHVILSNSFLPTPFLESGSKPSTRPRPVPEFHLFAFPVGTD